MSRRRARVAFTGENSRHDVAIRDDDSDQPLLLDHERHADVLVAHLAGDLGDRRGRAHDGNVRCDDLFAMHMDTPLLPKTTRVQTLCQLANGGMAVSRLVDGLRRGSRWSDDTERVRRSRSYI